jgi:hypothetical protein
VAKKKKAKMTARGKTMHSEMIFGKKQTMRSSFSRRPPTPLFVNDENEEEEEEEEEDQHEEEEEEEEDERKGWSD